MSGDVQITSRVCTRCVVDHSHVDGRVRGLLCRTCNTGLGLLKDGYPNVQRAARYLLENDVYMKIVVVSGSGRGAGKSTFARKMSKSVWSIAGALRAELQRTYPAYDWFNTEQHYKDNTIVRECNNRTVREVLIEHGQERCDSAPNYWIDRLIDKLTEESKRLTGVETYAIDDLRKAVEIERLRAAFPGRVLHFHIDFAGAIPEPEFENDALKVVADYVIRR